MRIPERSAEIHDINALEKWLEGAGDVGPDDEVLSGLWQRLLSGIIEGKRTEAILLERLKDLSEEDARLLVLLAAGRDNAIYLWRQPIKNPKALSIQRLAEKGVIRRNYSVLLPVICGAILVGFCSFVLVERYFRTSLTVDATVIPIPLSSYVDGLTVSLILIAAFIAVGRIATYEPNALGQQLLQYVPEDLRKRVLELEDRQ